MPSKYDEYFEIDTHRNEARCKTCENILKYNCDGLNKHMRTKHQIIIPKKRSLTPEEIVLPGPSKKLKLEEVEPIDDQICEDVSRFGATFR